ncbi:hypothetical protein Trydic_g4290 [Trypoxylus dichotomus]
MEILEVSRLVEEYSRSETDQEDSVCIQAYFYSGSTKQGQKVHERRIIAVLVTGPRTLRKHMSNKGPTEKTVENAEGSPNFIEKLQSSSSKGYEASISMAATLQLTVTFSE